MEGAEKPCKHAAYAQERFVRVARGGPREDNYTPDLPRLRLSRARAGREGCCGGGCRQEGALAELEIVGGAARRVRFKGAVLDGNPARWSVTARDDDDARLTPVNMDNSLDIDENFLGDFNPGN